MFPEAVLWRDAPERFGKEARLQAVPTLGVLGCLRTGCGRAPDEFDPECVFAGGTIVQVHRKAAGARGAAGRVSDAREAA